MYSFTQETSKTDKGKSVAIDSVQFDNVSFILIYHSLCNFVFIYFTLTFMLYTLLLQRSLSAMEDHDPDNLLPNTPSKRKSTNREIDQVLSTE